MREITTLKEMINEAAARYTHQVAYRYIQNRETVEKTYEELKRDSEAFSRTIESLGSLGEHIAIIGPTSYEYIVVYLGTTGSGSVIVPIDRELSGEAVCELLNRADISIFVYDKQYEEIAELAKRMCPEIKYFIGMKDEGKLTGTEGSLSLTECLRQNQGEFSREISPESLACILFTSGTTGQSKGVMLTHKNLIHNVTCVDMKLPKDTVILSVLPIHHAYCFTCDILLGLYLGVTACINDSMMHLTRNLKRFSPTMMLVVPLIVESMYHKLCEAAKAMPQVPKEMIAKGALGGRLHTIYCGGAYLHPKYIQGFREFGITLMQGYGMTESSPRISCNFEWLNKEESVGKLLPGTEAKCVEGEIWVKSDSVMKGYYKNPEATNETLQDGWLKTGDLGYIDEDGFVYITGRKKNLIILSNGENVSAEAIENKLYEEPLVAEVLVYGENNLITAEIYPNEEVRVQKGIAAGEEKEVLQQFIDQMNASLPLSKRVHTLKIRETAFEKTTSRKIKRNYAKH